MEEGGSFDLSKDLEIMIEQSYKSIKNRRLAAILVYSLEVFAIIAVIFILVLVFLNN